MTTRSGTAFRVSGTQPGSEATITARSQVEQVALRIDTIGRNDIAVSSAFSFTVGAGTIVSSKVGVASFFVDDSLVATLSRPARWSF